MSNKILFSLVLLFLGINCSKQEVPEYDFKKVDAVIDAVMTRRDLPSVAMAVQIGNDAGYSVSKGMANLQTNLPREINEPFRIASITKTFIATAVLILADEGLLNVNDKLSKWYPDFPNADVITIDDLLRMRSGIYDHIDEIIKEYYMNPTMNADEEEMIEATAGDSAKFVSPGSVTKYCNINYTILQRIIEKVTGKKAEIILKEKIFEPLKLNNTIYPTTDSMPGNLHGYSWDSAGARFIDKTNSNPNLPGGAGAMISTIGDLKIYARALYKGTLLKPETQKERLVLHQFDGLPDYYGYGQGILRVGKFYGHNGTDIGFSSEMFYLPEKDAIIVISVNRLDVDDKSQSGEIFAKVTKILFPEDVSW